MTQSETAEKYNIDNTPNETQLQNLKELINGLLNPFRESWENWCIINSLGTPAIEVTSGFRSKRLNEKIGGSNTSAHSYGLAADLVPCNGNLKEFRKHAERYMPGVKFDQCIFEEVDKNGVPKWIHLGYKNKEGNQRSQFMEYKNKVYTNINV
jgi:putative chitinase